MRHFTLVNSSGVELDITTKEILFHEIGGLGFEEENDFRQIGDVWWLNRTGYNQATVSGKVIFTEEGTRTPYEKYWDFVRFIAKAPLTLKYSPYGEIDDDDKERTFYRRVRVSKLDKTEITTLGVLDCDIEFICYTPWYRVVTNTFIQKSQTGDLQAWIWGNGSDCPPLTFEPEDGQTATRAKFRDEDLIPSVAVACKSLVKCPAKLTIYGPVTNPTWTHEIERSSGDILVGTGGFSPSSPVSLSSNEYLVIDATNGSYSITKHNANGTVTNVYQYRDFNKSCFITLHEGTNIITVLASSGTTARRFELESHLYYATV